MRALSLETYKRVANSALAWLASQVDDEGSPGPNEPRSRLLLQATLPVAARWSGGRDAPPLRSLRHLIDCLMVLPERNATLEFDRHFGIDVGRDLVGDILNRVDDEAISHLRSLTRVPTVSNMGQETK